MGVLGLIATYQGLHVLQTTGFWAVPVGIQNIGEFADATIAALYFCSTLMIQFASRDRHNARIQLRMVEAQPSNLRPARELRLPPERTALAVFGLSASGEVNLWHSTSEAFFGWRREDVLGTRLPFKGAEESRTAIPEGQSGLPRMIGLKTRYNEELEALAWFMPVPGESGCLVLVLDYRKARRPERARTQEAEGWRQAAEGRIALACQSAGSRFGLLTPGS